MRHVLPVEVRPERPADYPAVADVIRLAFGQENEVRLVRALRRAADFIPELSLVAVQGGEVVGHVLFSRISIAGDGVDAPALALAPLAVRPEFQRRGVGTALVRAGLEACRPLGYRIVVVVGEPDYYGRFGFGPARTAGLEAPFPVPDDAFMVLALAPGALDGVRGLVIYPPPFDEV